jgi:hypothetical protein
MEANEFDLKVFHSLASIRLPKSLADSGGSGDLQNRMRLGAMNRCQPKHVMDCGGKRSATPLFFEPRNTQNTRKFHQTIPCFLSCV